MQVCLVSTVDVHALTYVPVRCCAAVLLTAALPPSAALLYVASLLDVAWAPLLYDVLVAFTGEITTAG